MAEGLQIQIGANVTSAVQGLNQVQAELDQTAKGATALGNSVEAASAKIRTLPNVTGQATSTLTNFSRVVQDAPFGIRGIANNIDPLVQSFNSLKASTGSTSGAFKALIGQLAGPTGIALGISVVTSLLVTFSDKIFTSGQAAKKAKSDIDDFNKSLDSAKASSLSTGLQLQKFVDIAKDGNLPLSQRNEALKQANDILGKYGEKLTLANVATAKATELVNAYTQGLIAQALANQYADRAATLLINQANAQKAVTEAQLEYNKAQAAFINRPQLTLREQELGKGQAFIIDRDNALKKLNTTQKEYADITKQLTDITTQFNDQALKSTKFLGNVGPKIDGTKLPKVELLPTLRLMKLGDEARGFIFKFNQALEQAAKENPINLGKMFKDVNIDPSKNLSKAGKDIQNYFKAVNEFGPFKQLTGYQVELAKTAETISGMLTPAFDAMIQAIGRGENAFKAFGEGVKGVLIGVIQKLTATAVLAGVLAALFPGGLGGTKGFGAIFGQLLGFRANGGPVSGNSPYIVGERGPELFVPSVSGSIVPNNAVGSFMGGGMGSGGGRGSILRGQDIILAYARTQRSQLRVNG